MPKFVDDMIRCPECERIFEVVWRNDGLGPPTYCPMCGCELDYAAEAGEVIVGGGGCDECGFGDGGHYPGCSRLPTVALKATRRPAQQVRCATCGFVWYVPQDRFGDPAFDCPLCKSGKAAGDNPPTT